MITITLLQYYYIIIMCVWGGGRKREFVFRLIIVGKNKNKKKYPNKNTDRYIAVVIFYRSEIIILNIPSIINNLF